MFDYDMPLEGSSQGLDIPSTHTKASSSPPKSRWRNTKDSRIAMANRSSLLRPAPSQKLHDWHIVGMEFDSEPKRDDGRPRVQFDPKVVVHEVDKSGQCSTSVVDLVTGECPCLYCSTKACDLPDLLPDHPNRRKPKSPSVHISQSRPREDITSLMLDSTPPGSYNPFTESILSDFQIFQPIM